MIAKYSWTDADVEYTFGPPDLTKAHYGMRWGKEDFFSGGENDIAPTYAVKLSPNRGLTLPTAYFDKLQAIIKPAIDAGVIQERSGINYYGSTETC